MKAYIFDFDGVLVDSMPTYAGCMLRILDENGIPYSSDIIKIITPLGSAGTAKYFQQLGLQMTDSEILTQIGKYLYDAYANHIVTKEQVVPTLQQLKEKGIRLNILTAGPHVTLDPCVKRLGIGDLFENIWSCDDFQTGKTDPNIYKMAVQRLGLSADEVLFLDDNYNADKAAKAAGLTVCGVYDDSSKEYESAIREIADHYIYSLSELLTLSKDGGCL